MEDKKNVFNSFHKFYENLKTIYNNEKQFIFKDIDSLQHVVNVINDASKALNDSNTILKNNAIADGLKVVPYTLGGASVSYGALYVLGITGVSAVGLSTGLATAGALFGGGMAVGVLVLSIPVTAFTLYGFIKIKGKQYKNLILKKDELINVAHDKLERISKIIESINSDKKIQNDKLEGEKQKSLDSFYETEQCLENFRNLYCNLQRVVVDLEKDKKVYNSEGN